MIYNENRVCFTINKAHGQIFKHAGIYQPLPVFPSGQLMVAFSQSSS